MSELNKPDTERLWGIEGEDSCYPGSEIDEKIGDYLDSFDLDDVPRTIELQEFRRMKPRVDEFAEPFGPLERLLDIYSESEYHGGDSKVAVTDAMKAAERKFIAKVLAEITVWSCEAVPGSTRTIDVLEWARENEMQDVVDELTRRLEMI